MAERMEALAALERSLETGPATRPSLSAEQWELRVDRVTGHMARGAYDEAARTAESLWREGLRDVRLVNPALFNAFQANGPRALPAVLELLHQVFTSAWERLGPEEERKADLADSGVLWLFKSIHKHLDFHGRSQGNEWRAWCESCTRADVEEALQHAAALIEALEQRLPKSSGAARLLQVTGWLNENRELFAEREAAAAPSPVPVVTARPEPVPPPRVELPPEEDDQEEPEAEPPPRSDSRVELMPITRREEFEEEEEEQEDAIEPALRERVPLRPARNVLTAPPGVEHSPALELLLRKLAAFDQLVAREDFSRASMVATDVLHVLEHFDPLVYLPSLFSQFLTGLSVHANRIEPRMQAPRSLGERSLERLYRVDLDAFLRAPVQTGDEP